MTHLHFSVILAFIALSSISGLQPLDIACCKQIKEQRHLCAKQCRKVIRQPIPNNSSSRAESKLHRRLNKCLISWTPFWECVNGSVLGSTPTATPTATLPVTPPPGQGHRCCQEATIAQCQTACSRIFTSGSLFDDTTKVQNLIPFCGAPPSGPFWKCLMSDPLTERPETSPLSNSTGASPVVLPADGAKLQCCSRAVSKQCRNICTEVFSHVVTRTYSWTIFEANCLIPPEELILSRCIEDVSSVCKLGCDGLSFCQAFNNRPLQPYRHCSIAADITARNQLVKWTTEGLPEPFANFPLDDFDRCQPAAWKALSCILQLKPCHPKTHINTICYSDCVWLMNECGHKGRMELNGWTSESLCSLIAPFDTTACLNLRDFIPEKRPSVDTTTDSQMNHNDMTYPCQPNPCKDGFVCEPNRKCTISQRGCTPFRCIRGCNTDTRSEFLVEKEDWVKIGVVGRSECTQLCQCGMDNVIESCESMMCGNVQRNCSVNGQFYEHGEVFSSDCNRCVCYNSQVTCSKAWSCSNLTSLMCENSACAPVQEHCQGVIPPGQCCPICGATILFLVGLKSEDLSNNRHRLPANEIDQIIRHMERLVTTLECNVDGFSPSAGSLVISVKSTVDQPQAIHVCNAEARRLVSLFESRSPIVTSNPTIDYLLAPQLQEPIAMDTTPTQSSVYPGSSHMTQPIRLPLLFLLISLYSIIVS